MLYRSTHAGREPPERKVPIDPLCDLFGLNRERNSNKPDAGTLAVPGPLTCYFRVVKADWRRDLLSHLEMRHSASPLALMAAPDPNDAAQEEWLLFGVWCRSSRDGVDLE